MDINEIEKNIKVINLKILQAVLANKTDKLSFLKLELKSLSREYVKAKKKKERERKKEYEKLLVEEKEGIVLLTKAVNSLSLESLDKYFTYRVDKIWQKLYFLLKKERMFVFGDTSEGYVEVKQRGSNVLINYKYFCHERKNLEFNFVLTSDLDKVLKSVVVSNAESSTYKSNFGHGSTTPMLYKPEEVLGDILSCFLHVVLNGFLKKEYYKKDRT